MLADYLMFQTSIVRRNTPRIYDAVVKTSEYLSPEVVVIAEQLVKVFIRGWKLNNCASLIQYSFCLSLDLFIIPFAFFVTYSLFV